MSIRFGSGRSGEGAGEAASQTNEEITITRAGGDLSLSMPEGKLTKQG